MVEWWEKRAPMHLAHQSLWSIVEVMHALTARRQVWTRIANWDFFG